MHIQLLSLLFIFYASSLYTIDKENILFVDPKKIMAHIASEDLNPEIIHAAQNFMNNLNMLHIWANIEAYRTDNKVPDLSDKKAVEEFMIAYIKTAKNNSSYRPQKLPSIQSNNNTYLIIKSITPIAVTGIITTGIVLFFAIAYSQSWGPVAFAHARNDK